MAAYPWFRHYDQGVPHSLEPYPEHTILWYISNSARARPHNAAILFKNTCITCGELEQLSDTLAVRLVENGVNKGDRLALILPNCPQFVIAELAAWKIGAIIIPINPFYKGSELAGLLMNSGAKSCVVLTHYYAQLKEIQPQTAIAQIIVTDINENFGAITKNVRETLSTKLQSNDIWFIDLLSEYKDSLRPNVTTLSNDPAIILMSSGTTGSPKGVLGQHRSLVISGLQLHAWLKPALTDWNDIIMLPIPLFHAYGSVGVQSLCFVGHNPLCLIPNIQDIKDIVNATRQVRPTLFAGTPRLLEAMIHYIQTASNKEDSLGSIKLFFSGGAPMMDETRKQFKELTEGRIVEGYSLTEAMMACVINPVMGLNKIGSVGLPLPDVEVRVDTMTEEGTTYLSQRRSSLGEVLIRAPQVMAGYWNNKVETDKALGNYDEDADDGGDPWLHTGDIGYLDTDGYLFIVDRKKDLIKVGDKYLIPREIEEVLASHPAVAGVAVAGVPDISKGQSVKAWIIPRKGYSVTAEIFRNYCKDKIEADKVPELIEICDYLPESMMGKVVRRLLNTNKISNRSL